MSAIAGVYLLDGCSVDEKDLKRMNDSMPHRGPDGSGLWHDGPVGLAHQMLWTTPESLHEKLPFEADELVITSDSRIDNREELLPELGLSEEVSDSEVILKAYGRWGKSCVDRLLGDFAFVIWDKAKEEMFCARDHMGVKPFYYYYKPRKIFAFATEIKGLFAWGVPRRINEVRIGDYLLRMADDKEITFYHDILRLKSANTIIVALHDLEKEQYWELDPKREIKLGSDEEYEAAFRKIFREAVRCRLRSAFPVGSMLSGGLDSSSIVCTALEFLAGSRPLKTFSIVFDKVTICDESVYINSVLRKSNIESYYIHGDRIGPLADIEKMIWHEDQPLWSPNLFIIWASYKKACAQSVRVLLDGMDGDTTISHGFANITEMARNRRLMPMMMNARGVAKNFHSSPWRILSKYAIYPFIPESWLQLWRMQFNYKKSFANDFAIVSPEFISRTGLIDRRKTMKEIWSRPARTAREEHWRNLTSGIHQTLLEMANNATAAFSIEFRAPFFDKRLIEFCLALPGDQKMRDGWTRWILRSALRDILPVEICCRGGKSNLSPNFLYGLLEFHKSILEDNLFTGKHVLSNYINVCELQESYQRLILANNYSYDDINIWLFMNLSLWHKSLDQ